jgi:hypothetical protein
MRQVNCAGACGGRMFVKGGPTMLHTRIATFEKLDRGDITTTVLGALVATMSLAVAVLLYTPLR